MILLIEDLGDETVGVFKRTYEVPCPFKRDEIEDSDLNFFKGQILSTYKEYGQGRVRALYDFEYAEMP